ncbi:MAG: hypothetical protein AB7F88_00815 [Pyrinomonadaceae bacterium]
MQYLEILEDWASNNLSNLKEKGIAIDFVRCRPSEKPAVYIDIDTARTLARVTAWSSGELQMEALEAGSGKQLIVEAHTAENSEVMIDLIENFVSRLT